jgi:hypothetical protein
VPRPAVNSTKISVAIHRNQMVMLDIVREFGLLGDTNADVVRTLLSRALEAEIQKPFYEKFLKHMRDNVRLPNPTQPESAP